MNNKIFNLSNDVFFKAMFSKPKVLAKFLSLYLGENIKEDQIEYPDKESYETITKNSEYDIHAIIKGKERTLVRLDLEMQNVSTRDLAERMVSYESRLFLDDLKKGEYYNVSKCLSLWILTSVPQFLSNKEKWLSKYNIKDSSGNIISENFEISLILLPNLDKCPIIELKDLGISFLENNREKLLTYRFKTDFGREVAYMLDDLNKEIALQNAAWKEEYNRKYHLGEIKEAKEQGLEQGKLENKKEMIISMHKNGIDILTISKVSNLTIEEIKKIIKM